MHYIIVMSYTQFQHSYTPHLADLSCKFMQIPKYRTVCERSEPESYIDYLWMIVDQSIMNAHSVFVKLCMFHWSFLFPFYFLSSIRCYWKTAEWHLQISSPGLGLLYPGCCSLFLWFPAVRWYFCFLCCWGWESENWADWVCAAAPIHFQMYWEHFLKQTGELVQHFTNKS